MPQLGACHHPPDRDERRHVDEGAQVIGRVEGAVEPLRRQDGAHRHAEGHDDPQHREPQPIRRRRLRRRDGRVEHAKLLGGLTLLQVRRELRVLVPLQERLIALLHHVVAARELLDLILPARRTLDAAFVLGDRAAEHCPPAVSARRARCRVARAPAAPRRLE